MKSSTSVSCDFCEAPALEPIYAPPSSTRGMVIHVCGACGLVQSIQTGSKPAELVRTTSSGADWGNVRHGKGARFDPSIRVIGSGVDWSRVGRVLDVGSNRGHFVRWMHEVHPGSAVTAIEPDASIVDPYRSLGSLELVLDRAENVELRAGSFDFLYSSHTLEHAPSAAAMLRQGRDALADGAMMYLEVPALEQIGEPNIVEEYFIDKHNFHFDRSILIDQIERSGFEIVECCDETELFNLWFLLRKRAGQQKRFEARDGGRAARNRDLIRRYLGTLEANRAMLRAIVETKLRPLGDRQKVAYWGAGRIFDALVKFGGLDPASVACLVDQFLSGVVDTVHGIKVSRPEFLKRVEPHVVVVLGRSSEDEMARQAHRYGVRHVVKFSDLMGQVR